MKKFSYIILLSLLFTGCTSQSLTKDSIIPKINATEIPCIGVEPKGISAGMLAYFSITGANWSAQIHQKPSLDANSIGDLFHHARVKLMEGPDCAEKSAWWKITSPDGLTGWVQIGSDLKDGESVSTAAFLPFTGDAVQQEVPESRKLETQVRYILADIDLGGTDVLKYYQDQVSAKPDDPEMKPAKIALDIVRESGESKTLANPSAFERKPFRGGTSVLDAGTEFVQPGLDILIKPCDVPNPALAACKGISRQ
jgi:hypothetical protein